MALFPAVPGSAEPSLRGAAHEASPWIRKLARLGFAAKGAVYIVMGIASLRAALTPVEDPQDSSGALRTILAQPFGRTVLGIVAVGLLGYVLWRLVQAILDPEHEGSDAKGVVTRAGYAVSALLHGALALEAARLLFRWGGGGGSGDQQAEHWTAMVMAQPLGRWVIGAVGAAVIAFGLVELFRAFTADLRKRMGLAELGDAGRRNVVRLGRFGMFARGVVFGIIGWFLIQAALHFDAQEATDLAGALRALRAQSHGAWLLGTVAAGLVAYGLWQLAKSRYRSIAPVR